MSENWHFGEYVSHCHLWSTAVYTVFSGKEAEESLFTWQGDRAVRDIPMLNMFLQRLHQHHYFPPIRVGQAQVRVGENSYTVFRYFARISYCKAVKK
jgi:hypothetical protein